MEHAGAAPRIAPGTASEIGRVNAAIARLAGVPLGGGPPNVMTTIARHRRLFRRWLRFAAGLMPGGALPRPETELVILRVAHNTGCDYERRHHEAIARVAGLSQAEVDRTRDGPEAGGWSGRQALLLRAADELHSERTISDGLWSELRPAFGDVELIELFMLVGHYEMLAMTLNALHVAPDPVVRPGRVGRLVQARVAARRRRGRAPS
jgi:AhpD family alkylhydroperoxidase